MSEPVAGPRSSAASEITDHDRRRLIDRGPFGYVACTPQGRIERVNDTLLEWFGVDRDELVGGRSLQDVLAPGDRIYFDTHVRPLLHMGGSVRDIAVELIARGDERIPVLMTAELVTDQAGGEQFLEVLVINARARRSYERELVRERERAERAQERLQLLYDLMSGFAAASTVEDVQRVVTAASASPFTDVRCHMWLFSPDLQSMLHAHLHESDVATEEVPFRQERIGSAFAELAAGELVEITDPDAVSDRYPMITAWLGETDLASAIFAPLLDGPELIGTLGFGFTDTHVFDDDERLAVRSLAGQTSHALRRTRSHEARMRSQALLERLYDFGRSLGAAVSVDDVVAALAKAGHDHFDALDVRIGRLAHDRSLIVSGGRSDRESPVVVQPPDTSDIAVAAVAGGGDIVVATRSELAARHPASVSLSDPDVEHVMAVPLEDGQRVVGAWVLGFERASTSTEDRTMLRLFADEAAQAIRRATLHERDANARRRAVVRQSISEALNRAATIDAVAEALVIEGRNGFDADGLVVMVVDDDEVSIVRQIGLPPDPSLSEGIPITDPTIERLLRAPTPVFAEGAGAVAELFGKLHVGRWKSAAVLPLGLGSGPANGLVGVFFRAREHLDVSARRALAGIAAEASVALGRAQLFDVEHAIAVTLQRSLLSEHVTHIDGWRVDPWYSPSNEFLMVGGDLYDVISLPDGRFVIVVGDVVGHGLDAASSLGQLRSAARALSLDQTRPSELISRLDTFSRTTPGVRGATLCCAIIDPDGRGRYACAGHPYPILVADGHAELLPGARSPLLGYGDGAHRPDATFEIVPGGSLVLYTDGVVERPDRAIDDGIEQLRRLTETTDFHTAPNPAETIGTVMLPGGDQRDDAVVVTVTHER